MAASETSIPSPPHTSRTAAKFQPLSEGLPLRLLGLIFLVVISVAILVVTLNLVTKSIIQNDMRLMLIRMETKEFASLAIVKLNAEDLPKRDDYQDLIKLQAKAIHDVINAALHGGETSLGVLQAVKDKDFRGDLQLLSTLLSRFENRQTGIDIADLREVAEISNHLIKDIVVVLNGDRSLLFRIQMGLALIIFALFLIVVFALNRYHRIIKSQNAHLQEEVAVRTRDLEELLEKNEEQMRSLEKANLRLVLFNSSISRLQDAGDIVVLANKNDTLLRQLVRDAMSLTGAMYGAIILFDRDGQNQSVIAEGMSAEVAQRIEHLSRKVGLFDICHSHKEAVHIPDLTADLRVAGLLPDHPPMHALVGVPLLVREQSRGVIYLVEKSDGSGFSEDDEAVLHLYAADLGHAIERADIYRELQDRNSRLQDKQAEMEALIFQLKDAQSQLLQSDKMASIGQLAAGVAHEINNPVGYVNSNLNTLDKYVTDMCTLLDAYEKAAVRLSPDDPAVEQLARRRQSIDVEFVKQDMPAILKECREGITRVRKIVNDLKDFSHASGAEWQWTDIHKGLDSTLNIVHNEIKYKAEVIKDYGDLPEFKCMPHQLNQVFMNLLVNAAHAIEKQGTIHIRTAFDGQEICVEITDTGKGIMPEHLPHIFEPFFTTKPVGQGTGLGLAISYNIVKKHGGRIDVASEIGKGARFRIRLPVRHEEGAETQPEDDIGGQRIVAL